VQVVLLGTAAGGGFPQWNCWCPSCRVARTDARRAVARSQSSAAVSADGERWFLLNASPDVRDQLGRLAVPAPEGVRHVPVEGVVLTDAELDHTLGIVLLREARRLQIAATDAVRRVIEEDSRLLPVTRAFAEVSVTELLPDRPTDLCYRDGMGSKLRVTCFPVPAGPPRFAREERPNHTVGLLLQDDRTGGTCAFIPGCGGLDDALTSRLAAADLVLFDGTFWTDDELIQLGIGERTARQMDHLPVSGPDGSLARLRQLSGRQRIYTHINNTNPMLIEDGPERRQVEAAGLQVGVDGMQFTL
jgi:pyrroloquinoline quinone biosynthesis protein B